MNHLVILTSETMAVSLGLGTILNTTESRVTDLSLGYMAFSLSLSEYPKSGQTQQLR